MATTTLPAPQTTERRPLRIWPALVLAGGMVLCRLSPAVLPEDLPRVWMLAAFGPLLCGLGILIWWLGASRATWRERLLGFLAIIVLMGVTFATVDKSLLGPGLMVLTIPLGLAAFAIGTAAGQQFRPQRRTACGLGLLVAACAYSLLLRSDGMWGDYAMALHWRWEPTSDELLAGKKKVPQRTAATDEPAETAESAAAAPPDAAEWPGFRGPRRDGVFDGPALDADWAATPPRELWRIVVGPGWSSFAVAGDWLYTHEQRGDEETVVAYAAGDGSERWARAFAERFDDPLGGPGPRATPTYADGALYTMGATGIVARLNPTTGDVVWQQDLRKLADREAPMWGYSSSPLVADGRVVVYAGGKDDKGLFALDAASGDAVWSASAGDMSYASPALAEFDGQRFILNASNTGLDFLDPATGKIVFSHEWRIEGYRSVQPEIVDADKILLPTNVDEGTRLLRVAHQGDAWTTETLWTSRAMKPDYNGLVVHDGHAYGFDRQIFACIDLADGKQAWKGGRYGKGQALLLKQTGAVLVLSEEGDLVLLQADPKRRTELGRVHALEGRTWNHPVVVGDRVFVRNSQEAACYQLPAESAPVAAAR